MIYINGVSGFIGGELIKILPELVTLPRKIPEELILTKDDIFIQMASPSDDFDFENREQMIISMLDDVYWNIDKAKDSYIVFASSIASKEYNNTYGAFKLAISRYLKYKNIRHSNLIIPRVYGKNRKKGLMKKIKNGIPDKDLSKIINFMDISTFILKLKEIVLKIKRGEPVEQNIHFKTNQSKTIKEIKEYYCL